MNSVERVLAAVGLGAVDRTPVIPVTLMQGARLLGKPLERYFGEPTDLARGQLACLERWGADAVFAIPHIVQDVLPWGAGIDFHPDGPPSVNRMVIRSFEDIGGLSAPDPASHPYLRHTLNAAGALAREVKGRTLIVGAVIGPFSLPSMLMGTRKFLELLVDETLRNTWLAPLMSVMERTVVGWANAQLAAGCDLVVMAEGIASASVVGLPEFQRHAKPVLARTIGQIRGPVGFEFVGHAMPMLGAARDLGAAAWLLGEEDPVDRARSLLGRSGAIMGTVNNLKLMRWNAERVEFEARRLIRTAGPGFILANQGPEVPWATPDENIAALVRAAHGSSGVGYRAA